MIRVAYVLFMEVMVFTILCLPAVMLYMATLSKKMFSFKKTIYAAGMLFLVLLAIDLVGTYYQLSSFTGMFSVTKWIWIIVLSYATLMLTRKILLKFFEE